MSVLPFPSFLDDIREKGLRRATMDGVDEVTQRVTAGLNLQDLRETLRGEAPSRRPNPRLQPHADGFWLHMRPSYYNEDVTGVYPTFRLGWLSTYFVFFETITGILLMLWYTPSPEIAYGNMINILSNVPLGQLTRDLHRLGAEAMVLIVALHMMRTWITGSYKKPRQFTWFTGIILLVLTGLLSFTGYLLPWDQLALWAVTIGASMAEATPIIGEQVNLLLRGAPELGANGLLRFYLLHVLALPAFLFIFTGVHYYKVIVHGHSLPPQKENIGEDTAKRVPLDKRVYFIPDIMTNEIMWVGMTTFILVVLSIWFYQAPLESQANPLDTPLGTTAPWYFLWIQGGLKLGDTVFWGLVFPTLLIGALAVMPYLDVTKSRRYADRRWMLTLAMLLVSFMTIFSYMGLAKFGVATSAEIQILHDFNAPPAHNHVGPMRAVPFDQLVPGAYTTAEIDAEDPAAAVAAFNEAVREPQLMLDDQDNVVNRSQWEQLNTTLLANYINPAVVPSGFRTVPADADRLHEVLAELKHKLDANAKELPGAWGAIIISNNQDNLRRVDVVISWDGVEIVEGVVQLDAAGNPIYSFVTEPVFTGQVDENGEFVRDENGEVILVPVMEPVLDERGAAVLDESGQVVMVPQRELVLDDDGNPVPLRRIGLDKVYLHRDSAYFD
jgi:ubiquinol-cytochrome c reductase cytochrome b subunit